MKTISRDNLGYLGEEYQKKLVKAFIEDRDFFKNIEPIVDQNMFTMDELKRIVGFIKDRFNLTGGVPTYSDLDVIVRSKVTEAITVERLLKSLELIKGMKFDGMDLIETECEHFFKQQNLTRAMNLATQIIKQGDMNRYNEIEKLIQDALIVNTKKDWDLHHPNEFFEKALSDEYRYTIPTGAEQLDKILMGGLAKGELGVIIAPLGSGKTSATSGFAVNAAVCLSPFNNNMGYKVFHLFFEDEEEAIVRKYYGYITGYESREMSNPEVSSDIRRMLVEDAHIANMSKMMDSNIYQKRAMSGEFGCDDLKRHLDHMISIGFKPDIVIIDYFECLKLEKSDSRNDTEWTREAMTIRRLEAIAHEYNIAMWIPIQGTKESINTAFVGMNQGGGSIKKVQVAHIILSFARTDEMVTTDKLNLFVHKFRAGKITKNKFIGITLNNGTGRFDMSESEIIDETLDGKQTNESKQISTQLSMSLYDKNKVKK